MEMRSETEQKKKKNKCSTLANSDCKQDESSTKQHRRGLAFLILVMCYSVAPQSNNKTSGSVVVLETDLDLTITF